MHGAAGFIDAAAAICDEFNPYVKVRKHIECSQTIQKMAALDAVHAAENNVASGNGPDRARGRQIFGNDLQLSPEPHCGYRTRHDFHLRALEISVFSGGIENPVEILLFHTIRIDDHQAADAEAR